MQFDMTIRALSELVTHNVIKDLKISLMQLVVVSKVWIMYWRQKWKVGLPRVFDH